MLNLCLIIFRENYFIIFLAQILNLMIKDDKNKGQADSTFLNPYNDITFKKSHTSDHQKSQSVIKVDLENKKNMHNMFELSEKLEHAESMILLEEEQEKSQNSQNSNESRRLEGHSLTKQEIDTNIKSLQRLWEYRYTKLTDFAMKTNDWFRLFSFLAQFKAKSIDVVKNLIINGLQNTKEIDQIDYRYNLKNQGEEGIFLVDGIVVRIAKIRGKGEGKTFDYNAVKALHQQFLSYNIINNLSLSLVKDLPNFPRIRAPLTCLVKYLGYTALCQADSPCDGLQTLVHGPTGTIYQYREEYMSLLKIIGKNLNLKQFTILSSDKKSVSIPFSLTVELHKINKPIKQERLINLIDPDSVLYPQNGSAILKNSEYYLMNISKLWPLFIDSDIIKSVGYLRPEVVISSKSALSNVVFCEISEKPDPQGELQLADACKKVKEDYITSLAKMLDNTTIFIVDSQGIQDIMHEYGINIRYIGSLAEKVSLDFNKKILETQMIARACKRYFFKTFHLMTAEAKLTGQELITSMKQSLVDFLNLLFIKNKEGQNLFKNFIFAEIQRYYDYKMKEYPPDLVGGGILHAIGFHFGVKFKIIDYPFFQNLESIFNLSHILEIHGSARTFDMDTTQIKQICKHYKDKRKQKKLNECIQQLKIISKLNQLVNTQRTSNVGPLPQSYFFTELAQVYLGIGDRENAYKYADMALKGIPDKHSDAIRPYRILVKYHSIKKEMNKCLEYYQKSLNYLSYHLGVNHPLTIEVYNTYAYEILETSDPTKCEKTFLKSLEICQRSLGYTHATSSEILLQLAELPLSAEKKINYYLQGLTILQNLELNESENPKAIETCMKISEMYYELGNLQKMIFFARKSKHWRMEMIGHAKLSQHKNVLMLANRTPTNADEMIFLFKHSFDSYIRMVERIPRNNLYKLYVSIRDFPVSVEQAVESIFLRLRIDKVTMKTVTEFMRQTITKMILEIPQLIKRPNFYKNIFLEVDNNDKNVRAAIESFMEMAKIVGELECQRVLTQIPKNF